MDNTFVEKASYRGAPSSYLKTDKRKRDTKAITLRIERWWLKKLEKLGHKISLDAKHTVGIQDLIREAIRRVFIAEDLRNVVKREGRERRREDDLRMWKAVIASQQRMKENQGS